MGPDSYRRRYSTPGERRRRPALKADQISRMKRKLAIATRTRDPLQMHSARSAAPKTKRKTECELNTGFKSLQIRNGISH